MPSPSFIACANASGKGDCECEGRRMGKDHLIAKICRLFYLALLLSHQVSEGGGLPLDEQGRDKVSTLPGQLFNVTFAHYSGYITVNEDSGRALFYWFFEAVEDPDSKPLVLWLNGGPGCSSIAYGLAEEIGPFHVKPDGRTLYQNPYSWNQVANVLFVDSPVGVGYSYSNNSQDILTNGDARTAQDSVIFVKNWLKRFPQFHGRELYLTGESYAGFVWSIPAFVQQIFLSKPNFDGHYVPQLAQAIVRSQKLSKDSSINLKGYLVGNALTDDFHDHLGVFQFMWVSGLISDQTFKMLNILCDFQSFVHSSPQCDKMLDIAGEEIGNIDVYSIFTPPCTGNVARSNRLMKRVHSAGHLSEKYDPCTEQHSVVYFNLPEVQKALHVNSEFALSKWDTCNDDVGDNWKDSAKSVLHIYHELIHEGLRIWMFSGDTDAVIPVTSTRYNIDALKLPSVTPWHPWYDDGQVGGWTQVYKGLTFVTVRGAGHEVALHKPKLALAIIKAFLGNRPMRGSSQIDDQ